MWKTSTPLALGKLMPEGLVSGGSTEPTADRRHEDPRLREELQRAVRLLLRLPLLNADQADGEGWKLVRRHYKELETWFREHLGYRLSVSRDGARLIKRPLPDGTPRPLLYGSSKPRTPFDARRYSLFCLIAAVLDRSDAQVVLSELAEAVRTLSAAEDGVETLDLEPRSERRAFVDAIRTLVDLGVLHLTDGDDDDFVRAQGDALYDVSRPLLSRLLVAPIPPTVAAGPEQLSEEVYPPTEEGRNRQRRHRILRRLIEEPTLYLEDLDEDELAYYQSQRSYVLRQVQRMVGLPVELRSEGMALIDEKHRLTDRRFPHVGTVPHAALVLADYLADRGSGEPIATGALHPVVQRLVQDYWSKSQYADPRGIERLLEEAVRYLVEMRLVERRPEGIRPLPAIGRFRSKTVLRPSLERPPSDEAARGDGP